MTATDTEPEPLPPLPGHADLHLHMFAEAAFGGGWFHGQSGGPADVALAMGDGGEPGDHARLRSDLSVLFDACDPAVVQDAADQVSESRTKHDVKQSSEQQVSGDIE